MIADHRNKFSANIETAVRPEAVHAEGGKALRNHLYWSSGRLAEGFGGEVSPHIFNHRPRGKGKRKIIGLLVAQGIEQRGLPFSELAMLPKRKLQNR